MTKQLKDAAMIALAHINWESFGCCRTEGHVGQLPSAAEAFDARRSSLAPPQSKQDYLETPIDWDLNGVPYTRKQAILDHCGPLALSYIEHAIAYYTKD